MDNKAYILQFTLIVAACIAVVVQGFTHVVPSRPLSQYNDNAKVEQKLLSFDTYCDGAYQQYLAQNAWKNTGFREFFSRCHNQVAYSCFGKMANQNVVKGTHGMLFLKGDTEDATGQLLLSQYGSIENAKAAAQNNIEETLALIDTLHRHGTEFLFVFCPTKSAVYPEHLPKHIQEQVSDFSLEEYYIALCKANGIPHIDFYHYFQTIKDAPPCPLYTLTGSHWAESVIPFVADSLLRKIETVSGYELPSIHYIDPNPSRRYSNHDAELENSLDLLLPLCKPKIPRPTLGLQDTLAKDRPNLLVVGDGNFTQLRETCFVNAFNRWDFWLYNQISLSSRPDHDWRYFDQLSDLPETLENADIVLAVYTSSYLLNYLHGFTHSAIELYQKGRGNEQETLLMIIESIKNDPAWMQAIEQQAQERGISIEDNLMKNAQYILQTKKTEKENAQP